VGSLMFMPWLFFKPLVYTFGMPGLFGLLMLTLAMHSASRKLSRKLESRADGIAKSNEGESGNYARALNRLYEDGLVPAVMEKERSNSSRPVRPSLAVGVTPDYPRPAASASTAWHGTVFLMLMVALLILFVARMIG